MCFGIDAHAAAAGCMTVVCLHIAPTLLFVKAWHGMQGGHTADLNVKSSEGRDGAFALQCHTYYMNMSGVMCAKH